MTNNYPEIRCFVGLQGADGKLVSPVDRVRMELIFPGPALPFPGANDRHFAFVELNADAAAGLAQILTACAIAAARQEPAAFVGPNTHDLQQDAVNCLRDLHDLLGHCTMANARSPEIAEDLDARLNRAKELLAMLPDARPPET
jgi:hypothetical protein